MHAHFIEKHYVVRSGGKNIQAEKVYYPLRGGCCRSGWKTHTSWTGRQLTEVKPRVQSRKEVFCHTHMITFQAFCFVSRGKNYIWEKKNKIHLCLFDWRSTEINLRIIWIVFTWRHGRHIYQGRPKDLRWCAIGEIFKESLVPWFSKTKRCAVFRILVNSRSLIKR